MRTGKRYKKSPTVLYSKRLWLSKTKTWVKTSIADPDPQDSHHFAGSRSIIFSMDPDPDPDLNQAHFTLPPLLPSSFTLNLSPLLPHPTSFTPPPSYLIRIPSSLNTAPFPILPHHSPFLPHPSPLLAYLSPAHHISPPSSLTRPRSPQFSHPGPSSLIHHLSSLTPSP